MKNVLVSGALLLRRAASDRHVTSLSLLRKRMSGYVACRKLEYSQHGIPAEVVELREERLGTDLRPGQVLVRMLACPVNPADINTIQVTYNQKRFSPIIYDIEYRKQCIRSGSCLDPHSVGQ